MSKYFNEEDGARAADITDKFPELQGWKGRDDDSPVKEVKIEAGYWRKANAIHRWFVENCQEGEDDCGTYPVGRADLERLRETCQTVLGFRHLADSQLPTGQGFFFGSSEYNDDYYQDVVDTIEILDRVLALPDSWEFEYQSSW